MDIKKLSDSSLKVLLHKHMTQSMLANSNGDKEKMKIHDKNAKIISLELESRKK